MASLSVVFDLIAKDKASAELNKVGGAAGGAGASFSKLGAAATAAAVAVAAGALKIGKDAVANASEAEQAFGGVDAVFGKAAEAVEKYASTSATRLGLAGQDYASFASVVGSQLQRMGMSQDESAKSTDKLITLGADLAATFGGSVSDAVSAVGSLLRGERDPIERYAVGINEAAIKSELAAKGLDGLKGAALEQAKAQVTLELLFKQTANAQGQSARESGTLQGQTQRLSAQYKDLTAAVGARLLPVITDGIEKFKQIAKFTDDHRKVVIPLTIAVGGLTAAVLVVNAATAAWTAVTAAATTVRGLFTTATGASTISVVAHRVATVAMTVATGVATVATGAWTVAQTALNVVLRANPIGLVITAVAALAAGVVIAYKNSDTFRGAVDKLWSAVKRAAGALGDFLGEVKGFKIPGWVKELGDLFGGIGGGIKSATGKLGGLFGSGDGVGIGGEGGQPQGVQAQMAAVRRAFPGTPLISGFRPGAVTPFGNESYHAKGRAVDLPPSMAIFNYLRSNFGKYSKELFFSPADSAGLNILNGKSGYRLKPQTYRDHQDHIHWAMHQGGQVGAGIPRSSGDSGTERTIRAQVGEVITTQADMGDVLAELRAMRSALERMPRQYQLAARTV